MFVFFSFSEQKLLLCGDQRHCDKKSEAGKMPRGALSSSSLIILLLVQSAIVHPQYSSIKSLSIDEKLANLSYFAAVFIFQVPHKDRLCRTDEDCEKGAWNQQSHGTVTCLHGL